MRHPPLILAAMMMAALVFALFAAGASLADGWDPTSQASNLGSIVNTRHNLSLTFLPSVSRKWMDASGQLTTGHRTLKAWASGDTSSCLTCHSKDGLIDLIPFDAFALGTDLTNDHPVGVQLPDTAIYDFNAPTATTASMKFYDGNGNSRADSNEIRFYNTGGGYEVECASCHDPHGVPSGGPGTNTLLRPSFLRVSNAGSAVCLTCHSK